MADEKRKGLEDCLTNAKTKIDRINALHNLAKYLHWFDFEEAQQLTDQATELIKTLKTSYKKGLADNLLNRAYSATLALNFTDGEKYALQATSLYGELKDDGGRSEAYGALYILFFRVGNYTQSLYFALNSLDTARNSQDNWLIGLALGRVGQTYSKLQDPESALSYYKRALELGRKIEDNYLIMLAFLSCAENLNLLQKYEEALEYCFQGLNLARSSESSVNEAHALNFISRSYLGSGQLQNALAYQQNSLDVAEKSGNDYLLACFYKDMGLVYQALDEIEKSLTATHLSIKYAEKHNLRFELLLAYELLTQIYKSQQDFENALNYSEKYQATQLQIHNKQNQHYRQHLMIQYETEQALEDVSYQRALREQEQQQFRLLNQAKNDLIASASHDLKNPLAAIRLTIHLLTRSIDNPVKLFKHVQRLKASVDRMENLIVNVLDLAILDTGQSLQLAELEVISFMKQVVEDHVTLATNRNILINFASSIDNVAISIDRYQFRRAIDNILSNAIKYTYETDAVEVRIDYANEDEYICIKVIDHGPGIPAEDLPYIFDRFYRVKQQSEKDGTGLGLAITKSIVEQHNGKIVVESQVDKVTIFRIFLPI